MLIYVGSLYITNASAIVSGLLKAMTLFAYPALLYMFGFFKDDEIQKIKKLVGIAKKRLNP